MAILRQPQVLVVDDKLDEAAPILRALAGRGIASVYFTGEVDQLPGIPFEHCRLAILDVDLLDAGAGQAVTVASLVNVIRRLIDPKTMGLVIVLWTKHSDWADAVWLRLLSEGGPLPIHIEAMSKTDFAEDSSGLDTIVDLQVSDRHPWPSLLNWEQEAMTATAKGASAIASLTRLNLSDPTTVEELQSWQTKIRKRLAGIVFGLATAELGVGNVDSGENTLRGAYQALAPLLLDEVENLSLDIADRDSAIGREIMALGKGETLPSDLAARINTRWNVASESKRSWTGNIYAVDGALLSELERVYPGFRSALIDHLVGIVDPAKANSDQKEKRAAFETGVIDAVLVDVHPICDYAQRKTVSGRLLAGARVSELEFKKIKMLDSMWSFGPLWDEGLGKTYMLVVDLKRALICNSAVVDEAAPSFRLRQSVMAELLARVAGHSLRPGTLRFGK